jgi:hypothetical protein
VVVLCNYSSESDTTLGGKCSNGNGTVEKENCTFMSRVIASGTLCCALWYYSSSTVKTAGIISGTVLLLLLLHCQLTTGGVEVRWVMASRFSRSITTPLRFPWQTGLPLFFFSFLAIQRLLYNHIPKSLFIRLGKRIDFADKEYFWFCERGHCLSSQEEMERYGLSVLESNSVSRFCIHFFRFCYFSVEIEIAYGSVEF